jgi:hypothetical protein
MASFSPRRPALNPGAIPLQFTADYVTIRQVFPQRVSFSAVSYHSTYLSYLFITVRLHNAPIKRHCSTVIVTPHYDNKTMYI